MSIEATFWHISRWSTACLAWGFIIGGIPLAFGNSVVVSGSVMAGRNVDWQMWVVTIASLIIPGVGAMILRHPIYYPDYVGGEMGYKGRDAFEKAQQRILKSRRDFQGSK